MPRNTKYNHRWLAVKLMFFVFLTFGAGWYYLSECHADETERGTFGDQFGFVNALFSGLAFAGVIYTIILQKDELECQRQELVDNRKEMERQTNEFKLQNSNLKIQRFESTFFNMLSQFQEVVAGLIYTQDYGGKTKEYRGRELFSEGFEAISISLDDSFELPRSNYSSMRNIIKYAGQDSYEKAKLPTYFDHYFRLLYRILKFVRTSDLIKDYDSKYEYTSMLRAILSRYELVWLYYNALSDYGNKKLKPLIEEFCMLKNLRPELLSCCKENEDELKKNGCDSDILSKNLFSGTDYEFFLTDQKGIRNKYYLSAFYTHENESEGFELVKRWQEFMKGKKKLL